MAELTSQWELSIIIFSSFLLKVDSAFDILNRSAATEEIRQRSTGSPPEVAHSHRFRESFLIIYALDNRGRKTLKCSLPLSSSTSRFCCLFHRELVENKESQLVQSPNSSYHHLGGQVKCSNLMKNRYGACAGKASDWIATLCHSRSSFSTCATQRCRRGVRGSSRTSFHRRGNVWMGGWGGEEGRGAAVYPPLPPPSTPQLEVARKPWDSGLQLKHFIVVLGSQRAVSLLWAVEQYLKSTFHLSV